jgi:4-aminobutyrate aminotransferase-like enzyme
VIRLLPSLAITKKQVDEFLEALEEEIAALRKVDELEIQNSK